MMTRNQTGLLQAGIFQRVGTVGAKALRQGGKGVLEIARRCIRLPLGGTEKDRPGERQC